jgi:peptidoglycan/LPS O-acetylase OafA/YrhL
MMRGITELQRRAWPNWFFTVSAGLSVGLMACLFVADSQATRNLALAVLVLALALALAVCAIVGLNRTISELQSTPSTTRSELTLPKLPWSN